MSEVSIAARLNRLDRSGRRWRPEGHPVRVALITWPMIVCLGATVAAAACMIGDCGKRSKSAGPADASRACGHSAFDRLPQRRRGALFDRSRRLDRDLGSFRWRRAFSIARRKRASPLGGLQSRQSRSGDRKPDRHGRPFTISQPASRAMLDDPDSATAGAACLAFAADGETLAVGQQDGQISLWNAATGSRGHNSGRARRVRCRAGVLARRHDTRHFRRRPRGPNLGLAGRSPALLDPEPGSNVSLHLSISPDGRLLALGDQVSPVVRIWNLTTGGLQAALHGPSGSVVALAISPDGTYPGRRRLERTRHFLGPLHARDPARRG